MAGEPLGGDRVSGERVFGPPPGTFDGGHLPLAGDDWLVPAVREAVPDATHERARAAVARAWEVVRAEAAHRGCAPGQVDPDVVGPLVAGEGGVPDRVTEAALTAVLAAARADGAH